MKGLQRCGQAIKKLEGMGDHPGTSDSWWFHTEKREGTGVIRIQGNL